MIPQLPVIPKSRRGATQDSDGVGIGHRESRTSSGDIPMPDYVSQTLSQPNTYVHNSRHASESVDPKGLESFRRRALQTDSGSSDDAYEQIYEALLPAAPANTPLDSATPIAATKTGGFPGQTPTRSVEGQYRYMHTHIKP